jgi:hypothetical protein
MDARLQRAFFAIPVAFFMLLSQMTATAGPQSGETPGYSNPDGKNAGSKIEFNWQKLNKLFDGMRETDIYSDSSARIIRTPFGEIYRDGDGNTRTSTSSNLFADIQALAIDPSTPQTIYAGTPRGILKSVNGGATWAPISSDAPNTDIRSLAIDPSAPQTIYAGLRGGGMLKSTDGGVTWVKISTSSSIQPVGTDKPSPTTNPSASQTKKMGATVGVVNSNPDIGNANRGESGVPSKEERKDQDKKWLARDAGPLLEGNSSGESGAELLNILRYYAAKNNVSITSRNSLPDKPQGILTKVTARIETNCSLEELVRLLVDMNSSTKFLKVEELMINAFRMQAQTRYEIRPGLTIAGYARSIIGAEPAKSATGVKTEDPETKNQSIEDILHRKDRNIEILNELANVISEKAYLNTYVNRDGTIQLVGISTSSYELIPKLSKSPLFKDVVPKAPFREFAPGKDQFNIEVKLKE